MERNKGFTILVWLCRDCTGIFLCRVRRSQHPYIGRTCFSAYCAGKMTNRSSPSYQCPPYGRLDSDCAGFRACIVTAPRTHGTLSFYIYVCKSCACYRNPDHRPSFLVWGWPSAMQLMPEKRELAKKGGIIRREKRDLAKIRRWTTGCI